MKQFRILLPALVVLFPIDYGLADDATVLSDSAEQSALTWSGLPGVDGKTHSLSEIQSRFVVVAFIANHCTLCKAQEKELNRIQMDYDNKEVTVVAISVSTAPEDRLAEMAKRAKEAGYSFAYLYDPSQDVGRRFHARRTPTVFLLNEQRKAIYSGAVDDDREPVVDHYLRDALDSAVEGKPIVVSKTTAFGCGINYK